MRRPGLFCADAAACDARSRAAGVLHRFRGGDGRTTTVREALTAVLRAAGRPVPSTVARACVANMLRAPDDVAWKLGSAWEEGVGCAIARGVVVEDDGELSAAPDLGAVASDRAFFLREAAAAALTVAGMNQPRVGAVGAP